MHLYNDGTSFKIIHGILGNEKSNLPGFEPGIFCSVGRRVIRCATGPRIQFKIYNTKLVKT